MTTKLWDTFTALVVLLLFVSAFMTYQENIDKANFQLLLCITIMVSNILNKMVNKD